ncbi:MAG: hypothetical protein V5B60_11115 [Accumulibacter sp.]|jgi:hypothetical protein|uniref:hypothetical protein n=1 Tax=Accumulibacter sp. TaxID=2053492 RepID=UPI002FC27D05
MNVVVLINGRDAIPVRALPFVVPSNMSPDVIVTLMGRADECGRFDELFAYQLPPHGCPVRVQPSEWSRIACKIMAFHDWIKKDEESGAITKSIGLEKWKDDSIRLLPAGVFVWKDEFISEHRRDYIQGQVSEDEYKQGGYDPNFEPLIYPERLQRVVMKGFKHLPSAATPDQTSPMHGRESPNPHKLAYQHIARQALCRLRSCGKIEL